ncbi:DUF1080 domain-containing protein [Coraliomargarita sp. SDUM461003]|uniref:DUF1080 domain-containing protein n=1 Tax=Thalassobacterium maritimum TaxID=3041265 RepID=A0ABU1AT29_9BACT|nr:DUF1080 domain-containing protein [Coraliomargarita sp. SDUM461003]MBT65231.1 hypothetical protein [Puniceicoccaceae bacterium]MDQ8207326.1 DUF1080 domain-containing protein [Coraliomargarita sp. SDUM461003]HBR95454.1 DUF1080 domain-containing protein [Opitutae bacterium]|tara:strand:- start:20702 stop:21415 length:714 start_codon:yes stop_codon:yes gene_type:complete
MSNQEKPKYIIPETGHVSQDRDRTQPNYVAPGSATQPPSDATVLFDGSNLDQWRMRDGSPATWTVKDGYAEVLVGSGNIFTKEVFGDVQLHLEFASPTEIEGDGQKRGNSGIFFCDDRYEVQILDNYENPTYPDGTVGAIYSQYPPLVNSIRKPGEWNSYDIIWHAPVFDGARLVKAAYITILLNGVLVQSHTKVLGDTKIKPGELPHYTAHPSAGSIQLQHHKNPVRFRNIWVRPI